MQQIDMLTTGGVDVLTITQAERPQPKADELLIKVAYAGVNRPDIMQRQGLYPMPPGVTPIMGLELAGEIVEVGNAVSGFQVGQQVCALSDGGAYAQYCVVPAAQALPLPENYSLAEAAALPETFFTVWANLFMHQQVKAGERLLIHGGTSGIGITALILAQMLNVETFATAGNAEKCAVIEGFGARAMNYREQDFAQVLAEIGGVDAILDVVGAKYLARNIESLRLNGRLFLIGFMGGKTAEVDLLTIALKRLQLTGSTLRSRTHAEKAEIARSLQTQVWPRLPDLPRPIIQHIFPFTEVQQAHTAMDANTHIGKVLLDFT
ncbi:zinc-binding dehydrogenase [Suttonella ornithocola]